MYVQVSSTLDMTKFKIETFFEQFQETELQLKCSPELKNQRTIILIHAQQ